MHMQRQKIYNSFSIIRLPFCDFYSCINALYMVLGVSQLSHTRHVWNFFERKYFLNGYICNDERKGNEVASCNFLFHTEIFNEETPSTALRGCRGAAFL